MKIFLKLLLGVLLFTSIGCGSSVGVNLGKVKGKVTLKGEELPNARVTFTPKQQGRMSTGFTDENGEYELVYMDGIPGALVGDHAVTVSTFISPDSEAEDPLIKRGRKETVPADYNTKSTMVATVKSGSQEHDLDLK